MYNTIFCSLFLGVRCGVIVCLSCQNRLGCRRNIGVGVGSADIGMGIGVNITDISVGIGVVEDGAPRLLEFAEILSSVKMVMV